MPAFLFVIPAKAGIQPSSLVVASQERSNRDSWAPAFAGATAVA
jgi:hypothetical protein